MREKLFGVAAVAIAALIIAGLFGLDLSSGSESGDRGKVVNLTRSIKAAEEQHFKATGEYTDSLPDLATRPGGGGILGRYGAPGIEVELQTGHQGRSVLVKVTADGDSNAPQVRWFMLLGTSHYGSGSYGSPAASGG